MVGCSKNRVFKERKKLGIVASVLRYRTQENEGTYYEEAIIDAWLHNQGIQHSFQKSIPPYRVDWQITSTGEIWEFVGWWNHTYDPFREAYRARHLAKKRALLDAGFSVREIFPEDMPTFKDGVDLTALHNAGVFECSRCKRKDVKRNAKGLCGVCYIRVKLESRGKVSTRPEGDVFSFKISKKLTADDAFSCSECKSTNKKNRIRSLCRVCYNRNSRRQAKATQFQNRN